jgi:hypothetical protein
VCRRYLAIAAESAYPGELELRQTLAVLEQSFASTCQLRAEKWSSTAAGAMSSSTMRKVFACHKQPLRRPKPDLHVHARNIQVIVQFPFVDLQQWSVPSASQARNHFPRLFLRPELEHCPDRIRRQRNNRNFRNSCEPTPLKMSDKTAHRSTRCAASKLQNPKSWSATLIQHVARASANRTLERGISLQ